MTETIKNLGPVIISVKVLHCMLPPFLGFGAHVGACLERHIRGDCGETSVRRTSLEQSPRVSLYKQSNAWASGLLIRTELDRNGMPRTTIVFREEDGSR